MNYILTIAVSYLSKFSSLLKNLSSFKSSQFYKSLTSEANSCNRVICLSFVEGTPAIPDGNFLLTILDDVTVFTIWHLCLEGYIVEIPHCEKAL